MSELQKHGQRHVKISNSTKDAGFLKENKYSEQKFMILVSGKIGRKAQCRKGGKPGKLAGQKHLGKRSSSERNLCTVQGRTSCTEKHLPSKIVNKHNQRAQQAYF